MKNWNKEYDLEYVYNVLSFEIEVLKTTVKRQEELIIQLKAEQNYLKEQVSKIK